MAFGYSRQPRIFLSNTATLRATLYSQEDPEILVPASDISSVTFTVMKPSDDPNTPTISGAAGVIIGDGMGQYIVDASVNDEPGNYKSLATFTFTESAGTHILSVPVEYDVADMFENSGSTPASPSLDLAWKRFEDMFDSDNGGPWLRDMTLAHFDKDKLRAFIPYVLLEINAQMPQSNYTEDSFPYTTNDGIAVFANGLFIAGIRHLMTSYVEQPTPMNNQVAYHSREEYHRRWAEIYALELEQWQRTLAMFKARSFDLTSSSVLISSKAGRLVPGYMRTRNVGRGWW